MKRETIHTLKDGCFINEVGYSQGKYFLYSWAYSRKKTFNSLSALFREVRKLS